MMAVFCVFLSGLRECLVFPAPTSAVPAREQSRGGGGRAAGPISAGGGKWFFAHQIAGRTPCPRVECANVREDGPASGSERRGWRVFFGEKKKKFCAHVAGNPGPPNNMRICWGHKAPLPRSSDRDVS